jgi:hypothetical protein
VICFLVSSSPSLQNISSIPPSSSDILTNGIQSHSCLAIFSLPQPVPRILSDWRSEDVVAAHLHKIPHPPTRIRGNNPKSQKFCVWFEIS